MTRSSLIKFLTLAVCFALTSVPTSVSLAAETRSASAHVSLDANAKSGTRYGYILIDAATGQVLSGENADALFIPASLAKIPTTLITLSTLGTERRFNTNLIADGTIVDGVLHGDLHLIGSGDPSLKKSDIQKLVSKLGANGIRQVTGNFTYNPSALPQTKVIDTAQPVGEHYNPPISGLNIDLNLKVASGRRIAVSKPGHRAAMMLRYFAHHKGITLPEPSRSAQHVVGAEIATHQSAPISQIIAEMMESSNNLTAESLGTLSIVSTGQTPKSLADAALLTSDWLKKEIGTLGSNGWDGFQLTNHSGLSTRSRATPRQMVAILRLGYLRFGRTFTDLHTENQPVGFQAYSLRGKFGTLKFVRGYAGFLNVSGREMIFAIMIDNRRRRARADTGETGLRSYAWMEKARELEQSILGEWIVNFWQPRKPEPIPATDEAFIDPLKTVTATTPVAAKPVVK